MKTYYVTFVTIFEIFLNNLEKAWYQRQCYIGGGY